MFKRFTYANVMSSIAVFIALSGGAYAAATLPKNSVGSKQIKSNAVTSSKVKNGALLAKDFKSGQLPSGATGPAGSAGPAGPAGTPNGYTKTEADSKFLATTGTAANSSQVGGLTSNQLLRGTSASSVINANTTPTTKVTASGVTAPVSGQLQYQIMVSCISFSGTTDTRWDLQPQVDGVNNGISGLLIFTHANDALTGASVTLTGQASTAAGDHTIGFQAVRSAGNGSLDCDLQTTSLFFPFKNDGSRSALVQSNASGRGAGSDK